MTDVVKIIECPRDAWQALPLQIPTQKKAAYLQQLLDAGFRHIDAVSFVSPRAVPQMADAEAVVKALDVPAEAELIAIVVNERGAERALSQPTIRTLGFPYSISPAFLERNQRQTQQAAVEQLRKILRAAHAASRDLVAYVSMAFGNPYGDPWSVDVLLSAVDQLLALGITQISLADTVGLVTPQQLQHTLAAVMARAGDAEVGVHLHARRDTASQNIRAAYDAGCRRFDAALGGLGGCPFAQDELVGNLPTEILLDVLQSLNAAPELHAAVEPRLAQLLYSSQRIAQHYARSVETSHPTHEAHA